jgi:hypothetical protein
MRGSQAVGRACLAIPCIGSVLNCFGLSGVHESEGLFHVMFSVLVLTFIFPLGWRQKRDLGGSTWVRRGIWEMEYVCTMRKRTVPPPNCELGEFSMQYSASFSNVGPEVRVFLLVALQEHLSMHSGCYSRASSWMTV